MRTQYAGIGSEPTGENAIKPGDSYADIARKKSRMRFDTDRSGFPMCALSARVSPPSSRLFVCAASSGAAQKEDAQQEYLNMMKQYKNIKDDDSTHRPMLK